MLFLYPRVAFISKDGKKGQRPNFQSCYWCRDVLPKQIMFADIGEEQCDGQIKLNFERLNND